MFEFYMTKPHFNFFFVSKQFEVCVPFYLNQFKFFFSFVQFSLKEKALRLSGYKFYYSFVENIHLFKNVNADDLFLWKPYLGQSSYFLQ